MKKVLLLWMSLVLLVSFAACGETDGEISDTGTSSADGGERVVLDPLFDAFPYAVADTLSQYISDEGYHTTVPQADFRARIGSYLWNGEPIEPYLGKGVTYYSDSGSYQWNGHGRGGLQMHYDIAQFNDPHTGLVTFYNEFLTLTDLVHLPFPQGFSRDMTMESVFALFGIPADRIPEILASVKEGEDLLLLAEGTRSVSLRKYGERRVYPVYTYELIYAETSVEYADETHPTEESSVALCFHDQVNPRLVGLRLRAEKHYYRVAEEDA